MKLEHVAINVPAPDDMARWYVEHLGLRIVRHAPEPNHTYFLSDGGGGTVEIYRNPAAPVPDYPAVAPLMLHFAFAVADIEADLARLVAAGAAQHAPIEDTPAGDRLVFVRDPWHVTVQLVQRHAPLEKDTPMSVLPPIPEGWRDVLADATAAPSYRRLEAFLEAERQAHAVFPPADEVFSALALTPYDAVRVVVVGQDPYHDDGQAHGLAFSVRPGVPLPPSLRNIFKERKADAGCPVPKSGSLVGWARQGVLLLNTVLTVRAHAAGSHRGKGWEPFTDAVIRAVSARPAPAVFVLWGAPAQAKRALVDEARHAVVLGAHPSPLSASRGFFGSAPFSQVNAALRERGQPEIDWCRSAE